MSRFIRVGESHRRPGHYHWYLPFYAYPQTKLRSGYESGARERERDWLVRCLRMHRMQWVWKSFSREEDDGHSSADSKQTN